MTGTCEQCGGDLGKSLPYNDGTCIGCHVARAETVWKRTGRLDIGLLGTAVLVGGERWERVLSELRVINATLLEFEERIWNRFDHSRLTGKHYACSFQGINVEYFPARSANAISVLDFSKREIRLGLMGGLASKNFKVYDIHASVKEVCSVLKEAERFDFSSLLPVAEVFA